VVERIDAFSASRLSAAFTLPIGLETVEDGSVDAPRRPGVQLTGLTVLEALQALTSFDPRYAWRIVDDTIVIRPAAAWNDEAHPLHQPIAPIKLERTRVALTTLLLQCLLGKCVDPVGFASGNTVDFSLDLPAGTILSYLNGVVRAHGGTDWTFGGCPLRVPGGPRDCGRNVTIWLQGQGQSFRVEGAAPSQPMDLSRFEYRPEAARGEPGASPSILGRIVPRNSMYHEGRVHAISAQTISRLSAVTGVPMGIEVLPSVRSLTVGVDVNGRTLLDTLNVLVAIDPRYEWRDLNGVVVIRPVEAWRRDAGLLAMRTPAIRFEGRLGTAQAVLLSLIGRPPRDDQATDTRTFRVDVPAGTLLDFLNATVLAHGETSWVVYDADDVDRAAGFRHRISFSAAGFALGVP
jgi:hypothetical protein